MLMQKATLFGLLFLVLAVWAAPTAAYPNPKLSYQGYPRYQMEEDPEELMDIYARINHLLQLERKIETEKRGLDFGLNRGFSGFLQAKNLMAQAAANYPGGPGRRKRDVDY